MHILVIHHWPEGSEDSVKVVAETFGMLVFEARQRMASGGPVIIASYADAGAASTAMSGLEQAGIPHLLIDVEAFRNNSAPFAVRHFRFKDTSLQVATSDGQKADIPYPTISHLLSASTIVIPGEEATTTTERKFSLGKTMLSGGLPMTKKVTTQTVGRQEERDEVVCLYAADRGPFYFQQRRLNYSGFGEDKKMSAELNFNHLKQELSRCATRAIFDDRLRQRAGLIKLLGTSFDPDTNLDLGFEILANTL